MIMRDSKSKKRGRRGDDECSDLVDILIGDCRDECTNMMRSTKRAKRSEINSSPNTCSVHDGPSPSTVNSKPSSKPEALVAIPSLTFSDEDGTDDEPGPLESGGICQTNGAHGESSIVVNRLKALCSIKEPTVNVGIEMVGAAYLLKLTKPSCDEIELAMKQAVEAAKVLFHAELLRNNGLQLLSMSQKSFDKVL